MHSDVDESSRGGEQGGSTMPATLRQCHEVIEVQALQISQLLQQMALRQEWLKLDSRNSSKPPSSDGPAGGNRAQRRASMRKHGTQPGHKGSFRATLDDAQV